ncbi:hypothetical protein DEO72_LG11g2072 [Vigna unguiculata]|uniref:Uncharacterized protein n=1 Tax=Vigna unguiculata TaxID=3917 RepID=A0A4D6NQW6_VIGUN|nr:hypothetical protein DEO72_LG11g2072 [Vigna unguiculata]
MNSGGNLIFLPKQVGLTSARVSETLLGACSGKVSPKRENAKAPLFHFSSSRLGDRSSPERENSLA